MVRRGGLWRLGLWGFEHRRRGLSWLRWLMDDGFARLLFGLLWVELLGIRRRSFLNGTGVLVGRILRRRRLRLSLDGGSKHGRDGADGFLLAPGAEQREPKGEGGESTVRDVASLETENEHISFCEPFLNAAEGSGFRP